MKKTLAFMLALSMLLTVFMSVPAMAADYPEEWRLTDSGQTGSGWVSNAFWAAVADPNGPKTIIIDYSLTLNNTNRVEITRELTIKAAPGWGTINSNLPTNTKHFIVGTGGVLTLEGLTLRGTASPQTGGLSVSNGGELYLKNCIVDACNGGWDPYTAAIVVGNGGYLEITGSTIRNCYNTMTLFAIAGAIYIRDNGSAYIEDTDFIANRVSNSYQGYQSSHIAYQADAELWFGDGVTFSNGGNSAVGYNSIPNPANGHYGVGENGLVIGPEHPLHISNKTLPVDKSTLQELYDANIGRQSDDYTDESWAEFQTALTEAGRILDKTDAMQAEVDEAAGALEAAIAALEDKIPVTGIKIDSAATTTVRKNKTLQLGVIYTPENANFGKEITWSSSNEAAVKVDAETGLLTGVKAGGSARITATSSNGKTYTITVTVDS